MIKQFYFWLYIGWELKHQFKENYNLKPEAELLQYQSALGESLFIHLGLKPVIKFGPLHQALN